MMSQNKTKLRVARYVHLADFFKLRYGGKHRPRGMNILHIIAYGIPKQ